MKWLVTAGEMQKYDRNTIERIGIPGCVLMERAALETLKSIKKHLIISGETKVYCVTGVGNNGGDGLALCRMLSEEGALVEITVVGEIRRASAQWEQERQILNSYDVTFSDTPQREAYDIIIDALFGVGLSRNIEGEPAKAIDRLNRLAGYKVALDLPSGVNSDTGAVMGCAFRADLTVTYGFEKRGLYLYPGCLLSGEIRLADVGIGKKSFFGEPPSMFYLDEPAEELLPKRSRDGNKGTFGKALLVAGSDQMAGAAVLAAKACYRVGAGMVKVVSTPENAGILQKTVPEVLVGNYSDTEDLRKSLEWCTCICAGPGLGKNRESHKVLQCILEFVCKDALEQKDQGKIKPLIMDADALNLLAESRELFELLWKATEAGGQVIMTPHMGELKRLLNALGTLEGNAALQKADMALLKEKAPEYAEMLADKTNAVIVAKDGRTYVCEKKGPVCLNVAGNDGMATAGSGDVLAGMITGLIAQGEETFRAACNGVRLHGMAGDKVAEKIGRHALMAGDIVDGICN